MEVSFSKEVEMLRMGAGETFYGEGILAITKALLQSGVSYVGGYQGAPVSHLLDVMVQAKDYMRELGVHVEACANEASAAAMLGASIHYPLRGAVTWKSIVGTNVAADALSNLSSPGVKGGVLVVVGEDYGEGASVIQERTHAYALKSGMVLFDPRPDLSRMVDLVEHAFRLSEASNMPALMELRIRACHVRGSFVAKDNQAPAISTHHVMQEPANFDYSRLAHPPVTFGQEKRKYEERIPAARAYIEANHLNEHFEGKHTDLGIIVQGGLYNTLIRALQQFDLADAFGNTAIPLLVLNVTAPLVPEQIAQFALCKRGVLVMEEGQPEYIELEIALLLRRRDIQTPLHGKEWLPQGGEYTAEVVTEGLLKFFAQSANDIDLSKPRERFEAARAGRAEAQKILGGPLPLRPPGFCVGCPERPVFSAIKLLEREVGKVHISSDIGCHSFATLAPFNLGKFLAPFHSVVLHYPIGFVTLAVILEIYSSRRPSPELRKVISLVMGLAALSAVVAAVLTPGPDVASQMLLAAPLALLYVVSIGVAWAFRRREPDA